jgi:hypothetical protein
MENATFLSGMSLRVADHTDGVRSSEMRILDPARTYGMRQWVTLGERR